MHSVSSTVVVVGGKVVVAVVVVDVVVVVVSSLTEETSVASTIEDSVTSGTFEVSVAYCEADCVPQPATATSKAIA